MESLFCLVIKSSIYGSLVGLVILLIKSLLRERLLPKHRYVIGLLIVLKLIIPFGPKSNMSIFNNFKIENTKFNLNYEIINHNQNDIDKLYIKSRDNNYKTKDFSSSGYNKLNLNDKEKFKEKKNIYIIYKSINKALSFGWFIVCITLLTNSLISYVNINCRICSIKVNCEKRLNNILVYSKDELSIKKDIKLVINNYVNTPAIIGIIKPKILLPVNMMSLKDDDIYHIFMHELAHYKRKDNIINLVLLIVQHIHWFNPFIKYVLNGIREDMELATDEKVLERLEIKDHKSYGITLLNVVSSMNKNYIKVDLIGMARNKKEMEKRIMNIKLVQKSKSTKIAYTLIGTLTIAFLSPVVLTSAQSSQYISYASIKDKTDLKKNKLSNHQSKFFELVESYNNNNKTMSIDEIRNNMKNFTLTETRQLGLDKADIYSKDNEKLIVYYTKHDEKGPYFARNFEYKIMDTHSKIKSISLSYIDVSYNNTVVFVEIATESIDELDKYSKFLGIDKSNSELYLDYINLLNNMQSKEEFTKNDIVNINQNFRQVDNVFSTKVLGKEQLEVIFDKDINSIENILLGTPSINSPNSAYIQTKTGYLKYSEFDVQKHYKEEYNLSYGKTGHIISINREDSNDAKQLFTNLMNVYSK